MIKGSIASRIFQATPQARVSGVASVPVEDKKVVKAIVDESPKKDVDTKAKKKPARN
jgi:hypothetical protein